jgi:hypothetical protein
MAKEWRRFFGACRNAGVSWQVFNGSRALLIGNLFMSDPNVIRQFLSPIRNSVTSLRARASTRLELRH